MFDVRESLYSIFSQINQTNNNYSVFITKLRFAKLSFAKLRFAKLSFAKLKSIKNNT